jgi:hypothetical protein
LDDRPIGFGGGTFPESRIDCATGAKRQFEVSSSLTIFSYVSFCRQALTICAFLVWTARLRPVPVRPHISRDMATLPECKPLREMTMKLIIRARLWESLTAE